MTNTSPQPYSPDHRDNSPRKQRRWLPWLIAAVALFVGLGIGAAATGGTKTTTRTVTETVAASPSTEFSVIPAPPPVTETVTATNGEPQQSDVSYTSGTYLVPDDIKPGTYQTPGNPDGCYWERDRDLHGGLNSIIANDNITGPTTIEIDGTDAAVNFDGDCIWRPRG